ncbi:glideosome-associated protein with multiple-membrane spans GAPM2B [Toxoplasma gondii RUB]|uniref:Glideosome-associated protein with multiple-membrane spans GAPM2B n=1 Tax=Toxoplasma gondii RUB TaxID=935652 RepID=A0A086LQX4_TOXGO|nr:glideosome-associated protein with multiple-membrane spans GAPM2B [Toxoplasma gondii RUB]
MYSLGVEGDETLPVQQAFVSSASMEGYNRAPTGQNSTGPQGSGSFDFGEQLTKQLTRSINENLRPPANFDETPRGENHSPFIYFFTSALLRTGSCLQAACLLLMCLFYVGFGGGGLFVFDEFAGPESVRMSDAFHLITAILMIGYLIGTFAIALFQLFVADSSKWTRGFRSGSKTISCAVTLDVVSGCLRVTQYIHAYFFSSVQWWAKYQRTQSDWGLYHFSSTLHAFALVTYGVGFFLMESYHDQGTYEEYAWSMLGLYTTAGLAELFMVYTGYGAFFTLLLVAALMVTVSWAFQFEPLLEKWSPDLHSRNLNENMLPFDKVGNNSETSGPYTHQATMGTAAYGSGRCLTGEFRVEEMPSMQRSASVLGRQQTGGISESAVVGVPLSTFSTSMPGANEMPTTYDYSTLQQQIATSGLEPGLVRSL